MTQVNLDMELDKKHYITLISFRTSFIFVEKIFSREASAIEGYFLELKNFNSKADQNCMLNNNFKSKE